jgi:hypothetical protein
VNHPGGILQVPWSARKWTDDLLDQRFGAMDETLELLFSEIRHLREELRDGFAGLRDEMATDRAQVVALHRQMNAMMGTALVAVIGLLGVLVAKA